MDDFATPPDRGQPDLASIVLARANGRRRLDDDLLPGPVVGERDAWTSGGYDARSVLVLAIVVAVLAMVVGWTATTVREGSERVQPPASTANEAAGAATAQTEAVDTSVAPVVAQPNLVLGRITAVRSGTGGVRYRVAVANAGTRGVDTAAQTQVLLLVDGEVVGSQPVGALAPGGRSVLEVSSYTCSSGRHSVAALVDPEARVRELDERDNATSRSISLAC